MRIGIIGGGAIGLLFSYYLCNDNDVTIFTRTIEQASILKNEGINLFSSNYMETRKVHADVDFSQLGEQEFIIIAVKEYDLSSLTSVASAIPSEVPLLFIQNGMGHLQFLERLPNELIFVGTVEHGARRVNSNTVEHTGIGKTNIAIYRELEKKHVSLPFTKNKRFPFEMKKDYEDMLISKLIANAVINPLTAVFKVKNGELITNPHYYSVFEELFREIVSIYPQLNKEKSLEHIKQICLQTKANTSSMLKDILGGGRTEIDAILGYILENGKKSGYEMPLTFAIYQMIKGMEYRGEYKVD